VLAGTAGPPDGIVADRSKRVVAVGRFGYLGIMLERSLLVRERTTSGKPSGQTGVAS